MNKLTTLEKYAEQLRLAELAVFLHNFGKLGEVFLKRWGAEKTTPNYSEQYISGTLIKLANGATNKNEQSLKDRLNNANDHHAQNFLSTSDKDNIFKKIEIILPPPLDDRPSLKNPNKNIPYYFGCFLDFHKGFIKFEDPLEGKAFDDSRIKNLLGSDYRAIEILQYSHELASGEEKEVYQLIKYAQSEFATWISSPYGFERLMLNSSNNFLDQRREKILEFLRKLDLKNGLTGSNYKDFYELSSRLLVDALGDTQIPINDVTLWDLSHSTASFFKSAVAGLVCSGKSKIDFRPGFHKDLKWKYLTISVDFHRFVTSSQKIIDMVHRKDYLNQVYDEIKMLLEVDYPLANEIYRDENGPVFLVPEPFENDELLKWADDNHETLYSKIMNCFRKSYSHGDQDNNGLIKIIDSLPHICMEQPAGEKKGTLQHALNKREPGISADPAAVAELWSMTSVKDEHPAVCPVCRIRPIGFDDNGKLNDVAKERKICAVCLGRRTGRAENWYVSGRGQTIWIEETADENGRAALLCGHFNLDRWLDGTLIEKTFQKNSSFARIRRCWETTNQFWQHVLDKYIKGIGQSSKRIIIKPSIILSSMNKFQAYELKIDDIYLNAIWLGDKFISADNLIVFTKKLSTLMKTKKLDKSVSIDNAIERLMELLVKVKQVGVFEPPHYSQGRSKEPTHTFKIRLEDIKVEEDEYFPIISILQSPTRFFCIVPASDAFIITRAIHKKYYEEMGKVRDRLPLNLGIVYFQKYVPAAAVLDAGNRLLSYPRNDSIYQIEQVNANNKYWVNSFGDITSKDSATHIRFVIKNGKNKRSEFNIALKNKDGKWDEVHPKLRVVGEKTTSDDETKYEAIPAREVGVQKILFSQSCFDYIYLDTASKRFETSLDKNNERRYHPIVNLENSPRPYQIEDIEKLHQIWEFVKIAPAKPKMTKTKLYGIRDLLNQRISDWHVFDGSADDDVKEIFEKFVEKIIIKEFHYAEGSFPFKLLKESMIDGSFFDCLDINLHILKQKLE